jgi:hypothetical protein
MTMSWQKVRGRTREIAVRCNVAVRRDEVLPRFLLEGIVVASAGGAAGAVLVVECGVVAWANGWPWMLSQLGGLPAIVLHLGVVIVATLYEMAYAAALDPVTPLRFER